MMSGRSVRDGDGRAARAAGEVGRLVKVATAYNQPEAELIEGLLRDQGIPSMTRRSAGFDVPDFLAVGPRDVLVPGSAELLAREVLLEAEVISDRPAPASTAPARPLWVLGFLLVLLAAGVAVVWVVLTLAF